MAARNKGPLLLIFLVLMGLVAGSLLSQLLRAYLPFLAKSVSVGIEPGHPLYLGDIFMFSLGFRLRLDVMSMLGLVTGLVVYWRM